MITITDEVNTKIDLIDKLLGAVSVAQLKEFAESEQVVAALKGTVNNPALLRGIILECKTRDADTLALRGEIFSLKEDLKSLIKILNAVVFTPAPYNEEFNRLKSKNYIY